MSPLLPLLPLLSLKPIGPPGAPALPGERLVDLLGRALAFTGQRPWLAAFPIAAAAAATAARAWWRRRRQDRLARHAHHVAITPPAQVDPAGAAAWWANLHELLAPSPLRRVLRGTPHVAVEYRWAGRQLTVGVWVPGAVPAGPVAAAAARAAWPGAATTITDPAPPTPVGALAVGGALTPAMPPWYPLRADRDTDPMRALVAAAAGLHATEHACVQVLARARRPTAGHPAAPRRRRPARRRPRRRRPRPGRLAAGPARPRHGPAHTRRVRPPPRRLWWMRSRWSRPCTVPKSRVMALTCPRRGAVTPLAGIR